MERKSWQGISRVVKERLVEEVGGDDKKIHVDRDFSFINLSRIEVMNSFMASSGLSGILLSITLFSVILWQCLGKVAIFSHLLCGALSWR